MKQGKIILSATALVLTVASSLAFKGQTKFNGQHQLFTKSTAAGCRHANCFTLSGGTTSNACTTGIKYYTQIQNGACVNTWTKTKTTTN